MGRSEPNLGLEAVDSGEGPRLRVVVDWVRGYATESGAPALTDACAGIAAFEQETQRLRQELDALLAEARVRLGAAGQEAAARSAEAGQEPAPRPRIATELRVRDVMSRNVRIVDPNARIAVAEELMKQGRFRHVVVVDDGDLVGVLSQRDIFYGALAWSLGHGQRAHDETMASVPVKQVMNTNVRTARPEESLAEAAARMREHKLGCLPVMADGKLVGVLTEGDFLSLLAG